MNELRDYLQVGSLLLTLGTALYAFLTARSATNSSQISDLGRRADDVEGRLTRIESEMRHLPPATSVKELELAMAHLQGQMEVLSERLKPVASVSDRLQQFLLDQSKK